MACTREKAPHLTENMGTNSTAHADITLFGRYQAAFLQAREAIIFVRQEQIVDYNSAALGLLGIDSEALVSTLGLMHFSPYRQPNGKRSRTLASIYVKQAMRRGQALFEWQLKTLDGGDFSAEIMLVRLDIAGDTLLKATLRDISRQKRLQAELSRNAMTDHLTGAFNRQRFDEEMRRALARLRRKHISTALILLDIDHFKPVNDTYGHAAGDDVLVELVALLDASLRIPDLLTRWGGEEFAMVLPDTSQAEALQLAKRLRQLIARHSFGVVGQITASLSVTSLHPDDDTRSCLKRLDDALYQAKDLGRNKVLEADPDPAV
ncbi:MAG: sensor domain-containing diguanylate cyclase [Halomonas subglaciescola]|nr:sensor domain-containing diguanylate cyclase [Halomonas subglaciescola]